MTQKMKKPYYKITKKSLFFPLCGKKSFLNQTLGLIKSLLNQTTYVLKKSVVPTIFLKSRFHFSYQYVFYVLL